MIDDSKYKTNSSKKKLISLTLPSGFKQKGIRGKKSPKKKV